MTERSDLLNQGERVEKLFQVVLVQVEEVGIDAFDMAGILVLVLVPAQVLAQVLVQVQAGSLEEVGLEVGRIGVCDWQDCAPLRMMIGSGFGSGLE